MPYSRAAKFVTAFVCALALAFGFAGAASAAKPEIQTDLLSNLAVDGYDSVAFFTDGKPVKGSASFATDYKGASWRFSSAENLAKFQASPEAYAPQYGGYCAWAVAQGYTAPGSPNFWTIVDGKLYLNYDAKVQSDWAQDIQGFIVKADANWPGVIE